MTLAIVAVDGERLARAHPERPLIVILRRHRQLREQVERVCKRLVECQVKSRFALRLEERLNALLLEEARAFEEVLRFTVDNIEDCAAKAEHLRWLLNEGDSGLEDADWSLLLQSFVDPAPVVAGAFS
jgi:hypothetical protein